MQAWRAHEFGSPDVLRWETVHERALNEGEVRLEIRAAAINFPDALYIAGKYQVKPTPPFIPGFEVAGVVTESRLAALPEGSRISSTLDGSGGYATHAIASLPNTYLLPQAMSFEDAAAFTVTYQTAWFALHRRGDIKVGDWVLVHAAAGGVGSAAVQLAKAAGGRVIATAGGPEKVETCKQLGAEVVIDYMQQDFVAMTKECTEGRGADLIFDPVGGDVFDRSTKCVAFEGKILVIGFTSGRIPELRVNHVLLKNYAVVGLQWGSYHLMKPVLVEDAQRELFRLYGAGAIKPLISAVRPLSEAPLALTAVTSRASTGKVLLRP